MPRPHSPHLRPRKIAYVTPPNKVVFAPRVWSFNLKDVAVHKEQRKIERQPQRDNGVYIYRLAEPTLHFADGPISYPVCQKFLREGKEAIFSHAKRAFTPTPCSPHTLPVPVLVLTSDSRRPSHPYVLMFLPAENVSQTMTGHSIYFGGEWVEKRRKTNLPMRRVP